MIGARRLGFSLVEAIIAIGIIGLFVFAIYGLLLSTLKIINDDQNRTVALGIARKRLELIKNLPYDSVGTVGGVPSGSINQSEDEQLNGVTFTIATNIQYVDDSFDGVAPTDTLNTDYKKVRVRVTWNQGETDNPVVLVANIVPTTIESNDTGGTIWIEVFDPTTDPVEPVKSADVHIVAPTLGIDTTGQTDADGRFILPGVPPGVEAYQVTVSKTNYGTDQTYTRDPVTNPNPTPPHLNVVAGEITQEYFEISRQINLLGIQLRHYDTNNHVTVPFRIHGAKTAGTDTSGLPIYAYDEVLTPNDGGNAELHDLPADSYTVLFDEQAIGYVMAGSDYRLPYAGLPQSANNLTILLDDYAPYTALITVINSSGEVIPDASVQLTLTGSYDQTLMTNSSGQVFFNPLIAGTLDITITATNYTTYTGTFNINGNEQQTFTLSSPS
jgi:hypothetical protein